MRSINITYVPVSGPNPPFGDYYHVNFFMRYGSVGTFYPIASYIPVWYKDDDHDELGPGQLVTPLTVLIDETINPTVDIKAVLSEYPTSSPFILTYTTT